ncbi:bifunctional coenzyme A synthase isoform X2 [Amyelois transitella]|nr:bifunctional coenzyme A synthase isoform X2 [Amyelois transitella]XP_013194904.1 bifunctional coenzyme A synthase isoform X2 [Amyelois transitella]XP_013194905.1 bifunctional coenzyme A synthase isoform X2 [Amyelois transitella]XP_060803286.1 bifunctional coenzyme A synthase isoform X2 [Amyelois transitella]
MAKNGLLFVSSAAKAHAQCLTSSKHVNKILYIKVKESSQNFLPIMSKHIVELYSKASSQSGKLDVRLILKPLEATTKVKTNHPIDLILYDSNLSKEVDSLKSVVTSLKTDQVPKSIDLSNSIDSHSINESVKRYGYVALGGTFDRLHNGHKILLSEAALRATKHLTVGVTDVNMIQSKKLWELIEPIEKRIKAVLDFLTDINPGLEYNVVPIQDMYGPTKDDDRLEMLVVSEETVRGGVKVNEKRKENGLAPLDTYVINLAQDSSPNRAQDEEEKVSSSNLRMRILGTMIRPPKPNPNIPAWPYVIGLAGGIASGKSNIAEKLKAKGAAIVNCDLIAHELYRPGLPLNSTLAETFGKHIITETGEVDRKKLGSIVFGDQAQLEKLNSIIWPAIIAEAENRIRALGQAGYEVVVMEAAVMVRAKWYTRCHQLWAVIIPPLEAVKRLQQRNSLTEEEAKQRIASQPSNLEQIEHANMVFSPFWSYEYTQAQIDRAWDSLQEIMRDRK